MTNTGDKVVSLRGGPVDQGSSLSADADIVATIEGLLEEARRGEITAIAYAVTQPNGLCITGWSCGTENSVRVLGSVALLNHRALAVIAETS